MYCVSFLSHVPDNELFVREDQGLAYISPFIAHSTLSIFRVFVVCYQFIGGSCDNSTFSSIASQAMAIVSYGNRIVWSDRIEVTPKDRDKIGASTIIHNKAGSGCLVCIVYFHEWKPSSPNILIW